MLASSTLDHQPDSYFRIYVFDYALISSGSFEDLLSCIPPEHVSKVSFHCSRECLPCPTSFDARYGVVEACTAVKPFIARSLLKAFDFVVYLDPDIFVYAPLYDPSISSHDLPWDLQLTPHILAPASGTPLSERLFMSYGIYNLGFFAIRPTLSSLSFLDWWCHMVDAYGVNSPSSGLFVDQKPLDFAPVFVSSLDIIRHPGWNVAWWNLFCDGREVIDDNKILFRDQICPLVFFHFSNLDRSSSSLVSQPLKHLLGCEKQALRLSGNPTLSKIFTHYLSSIDDLDVKISDRVSFANSSFGQSHASQLSRHVNAELYRYSLYSINGVSQLSNFASLIKLSFLARYFLVFVYSFRYGINIFKFPRSRLRCFVFDLFSPLLFDYSSRFGSSDVQPDRSSSLTRH